MGAPTPPGGLRVVAGVLALVAGVLILLFGALFFLLFLWLFSAVRGVGPGLSAWGFLPLAIGLGAGGVVLTGGIVLLSRARWSREWGVIVLVFSIVSLIDGGGLLVGFALGLVAGVLGLLPPSPPWSYGWGAPGPVYLGGGPWVPLPFYVVRFCTRCGTALPPGAPYCAACGVALPPVTAPPTTEAPPAAFADPGPQ